MPKTFFTVSSQPYLPSLSPANHDPVVFTSGSTGTPKGIITTHANFASAATYQRSVLRITPNSRVFDFVSYNFDVSWSNHLQTLISGGCLCIPSETERRNDIPGAFNRMNCNYSYFTPSVAKSLDPASMPGLRTLAMGGEAISSKEVARWTQAETIIGIYGPAECAQALTFTDLTPNTRNGHVGRAYGADQKSYGANTWLVLPGRPDRLAPIGSIGELMIEGPTVSKGYFGSDAARTSASYLVDPPWLVAGGRRGTLYLAGDLLRYDADGSLDFIGRKDGMIKLRGQRIELSEVEYHVRACLRDASLVDGVVAEIITPKNGKSPLLAVFLSLADGQDDRTRLSLALEGMEEKLWDRVPQYMVPGAYIHVDNIPMTTTNKTDRRALRKIGNSKTLEELAEIQPRSEAHRAPSTDMEMRLQALWSRVLEIDASSIHADSSFLRIGGESIAAMRLVAAAREQKLSLTVADIFKAPRLSDLALLVKMAENEELQVLKPFSLLAMENTQEFLETEVLPVVDPGAGTVRDVIPATDFQAICVAQALQDPPARYPHWVFDLPSGVDFTRLEQACVSLARHFDILHTVFVHAAGRYWQVLLDEFKLPYDTLDAGDGDLATFTDDVCKADLERPRKLGYSFVRFVAIKHSSGNHKLVFRISHAHFDGFSWGTLMQTLSSLYLQTDIPHAPPFSQYIAFNDSKWEVSVAHWSPRLHGSSYPSWSNSDSSDRCYPTSSRLTISETIPIPDLSQHEDIPPATLFHAACAIALSQLFKQEDVIFGRLVTGRSMLPGSLQDVVGPTMTEVPIRAHVTSTATLSTLSQALQSQFIEDATFESAGMLEIIRHCTDWPEEAKDFGWRTSFQQEEDGEFEFLGEKSKVAFYQRDMPPRSRPEVYATPDGKGAWVLEFEGNSELIDKMMVTKFFELLKGVLIGA